VLVAAAIAAVGVTGLSRPIALGPDGTPRGPLPPVPDMRIAVNTCTAAELTVLPGIGPRLAERIVVERAAGGRFRDVDDVQRVAGIGPALAERMAPYVVID
jgi:competence protein ComEA